MGYTTDFFNSQLKLNKQLSVDDKNFLEKLADTRRMARNVDPKYGVEGEFYVDGNGFAGQDRDDSIIDYNVPPKTQPGLWLQWVPTEDGWGLEWNGAEKFYNYAEWLEYIIDNILEPRGYVLNGSVEWSGEDQGDVGKILVKDNVVTVQEGAVSYDEPAPEKIDNSDVWKAINFALVDKLGMKHEMGGDGDNGDFVDEYYKGDYKVTISMRN